MAALELVIGTLGGLGVGLVAGYLVSYYRHVEPLLEQLMYLRRQGFEPRFPIEEPEPIQYPRVRER